MADMKHKYYEAKLRCKEEAHRAKMEQHKLQMSVLALQQKYYMKQLNEQ